MGFDLGLIARATGVAAAPAFETLATREDTYVALLEDNPTLFTKIPRGGRKTSGAKRGRPSNTAESPEAKRSRSKAYNSIYIHTDVMKLTWKEGEYTVKNLITPPP